MRDTERERQRHRWREKQAPCRKPDAELNPGTPGSRPGAKADAKPLSHPGIPSSKILMESCLTFRSFIHFEFIFVYGLFIPDVPLPLQRLTLRIRNFVPHLKSSAPSIMLDRIKVPNKYLLNE